MREVLFQILYALSSVVYPVQTFSESIYPLLFLQLRLSIYLWRNVLKSSMFKETFCIVIKPKGMSVNFALYLIEQVFLDYRIKIARQ